LENIHLKGTREWVVGDLGYGKKISYFDKNPPM